MNWSRIRRFPWLDSRAAFVARTPHHGALLDLGSSDGQTLGHIYELRPDLRLFAVDIAGCPEKYPPGCQYRQANLERDTLPWADASMDAITCMQLVEHLNVVRPLMREVARLLKPGGRAFFETPRPRTLLMDSPSGRDAGTFTLNFFDDPTHVRIVSTGALAVTAREAGLEVTHCGVSRNWLFAAARPFSWLMSNPAQRLTARVHWSGWSASLIVRRK
jgi:SAM-dependent methyltransferase